MLDDARNRRKSYVYVLRDPRTGDIRYVGKTVSSLHKRLTDHISDARRRRTHYVAAWINSVLDAGHRPIIEQLETHSTQTKAYEREKFWIEKLKRDGHRLTNLTDGGVGQLGRKQTDEEKRKKSEANRGQKRTFEQKKRMSQWQKGRSLPDWHKKLLSESHTGKVLSDDHKRAIGKANTGSLHSMAILDEDIVLAIKNELKAGGTSHSKLGEKYGVSKATISHISRGKTWKHVTI